MGNTGSCVGRSSSTPKKSKDGNAPAATRHGIPLAPGQPRLREATQTSLHVEWDKPASDGGSTIFAYIIKMSRAEGSAWRKLDADCEGLDYLAKNLEPGESYKFYVQCENDNGVSKPSEISEVFTTKTYEIIMPTLPNDVNENVKESFGPSAEKYVKEEEEDNKSQKSEHSHKSEKSDKSEHSHKSKTSSKSGSSKDSGHSKDSQKSQDGDKDEKDSHKSDNEVKEEHFSEKHVVAQHTIQTSTIVTAVSNEKEFAVTADDDVGHGKPLNLGAYSYSSDSLLDDEDTVDTMHRYAENGHDQDVKIHTSYEASMEEYQTFDNEIPDEHRDVIMDLQYMEIDPNDYNRLSIISERSVEESVGTPDANTASPTKDGTHFTFVKKYHETSTNAELGGDFKKEVEESNTKVSGTEKSTVVFTKSQTESKPMETRIPMMSGKTMSTSTSSSSVTKEVTTTMKDVKVQSKLPTIKREEKTEEVKTTYTEERKSSIPELERKSSIPKLAAPKVKVEEKVKVETKVESKIPSRRGSTGKGESGIAKPSPTRSSGETSPSMKPASPSSGIPTGIAVRTKTPKESPKFGQTSGSRIPSPGTKSGIPPPKVNISAS